MSVWKRAARRARRIVDTITDRFTKPSPPPPSRKSREPRPEPSSREPDKTSRLPDGWIVAGLYHDGEKTTRIHATNDTDVTDSEISHADGIIVQYVDGGEDGYKWIHGANGWDSIADQIEITVKVVSPQGTGE